MWAAKITLTLSKGALIDYAINLGIKISGYPLRFQKQKNKIIITFASRLSGPSEAQKKFIQSIQKDNRYSNIHFNDDLLIFGLEQPFPTSAILAPDIIFCSPLVAEQSGMETFQIASSSKESITKIFKMCQLFGLAKMNIRKTKVPKISVYSTQFNLSAKQLEAVSLAKAHGYYEYPRKVWLKSLAKIMKISYTAYHKNLRKAETKILDSVDLL